MRNRFLWAFAVYALALTWMAVVLFAWKRYHHWSAWPGFVLFLLLMALFFRLLPSDC